MLTESSSVTDSISRRAFVSGAAASPLAAIVSRSEWKAGIARVRITPDQPIWMAGYAARTRPSEGVLLDINAKALALDGWGGRAIIVTADVLGFPRTVADRVASQVRRRYGIRRERFLLNASHTHSGPVIGDNLRVAYAGMGPDQEAGVHAYTRSLEERIISCVGDAIKDLQPARLSFGHSTAGFAMNRRFRPRPEAAPQIAPNPAGPVDHDVPLLRVDDESGNLRVVLFGYACHNTTFGGDFYRINGDYAGFAQEALEKRHPDAVAMYLTGCGGDQNPDPRGNLELARRHGESLANAVSGALQSLKPVSGPLRCAWATPRLSFAPPPGKDVWTTKLSDPDIYVQRHAKMMLAMLERDGKLPVDYPYPVQTWRFDNDLTLIALGGEVVVDYVLRLKKELGEEKLWVAAYCNDVMAYIPSLRVLKEGGYEGGGAMIYYGQPGPWAESVEETIVGKVHDLLRMPRRASSAL